MTALRLFVRRGHRGLRRSFSSTSFGIAGLEHEFSVVEHTPIFSQLVTKLLLPGSSRKLLLDMTFGSGGHANLVLDHKPDMVDRIVVCDCDRIAYNEAKELRARKPEKVVPFRARFHNLPNLLLDNGFTPGCFDGILIDTGCSTTQWADASRGFCPNKAGMLDMRYEPTPATPTGSEVLQNISDRDLLKLIKSYSGLGPNLSKYVTNAIVESRYMFHKFQTTQELYEVLKTAARTYIMEKQSKVVFKNTQFDRELSPEIPDERELSRRMMKETLNALKLFVNNDVNELHFAINHVARNFLKPESGTLVTIVSSAAERKVVEASFKEADFGKATSAMDDNNVSTNWLPWTLLYDQPQELTPAEKTLNPRLQNSTLYAASINE